MPKIPDEGELPELIAKAKAGDRVARARIFLVIKPQLDEWSAQLLQRGGIGIERPSDIAQEVALHAFDKLSEFRGSTAKEIWAWLRTILERRISEAIRKSRRKKRDTARSEALRDSLLETLPGTQPSPSQESVEAERWRQLLGQVFYLKDEQREVVVSCLFKRRTVLEVAAERGCSRATVVGLLQRAVENLQGKLADNEKSPTDDLDPAGKALLVYLERRDRGDRFEREAFLAEHNESRAPLTEMLVWLDSIEASRPPAGGDGR
jgi:RNA polymerase sigma-70 factor, ECF subfamily